MRFFRKSIGNQRVNDASPVTKYIYIYIYSLEGRGCRARKQNRFVIKMNKNYDLS